MDENKTMADFAEELEKSYDTAGSKAGLYDCRL